MLHHRQECDNSAQLYSYTNTIGNLLFNCTLEFYYHRTDFIVSECFSNFFQLDSFYAPPCFQAVPLSVRSSVR